MRTTLIVLLLALSACSRRGGHQAEYDSSAARDTLVAALDAWKEGKASELPRRQPPIRFTDDDLVAGCRLEGYDLAQPAVRMRPFESVSVELRLRDRKGKAVKRTAAYQVALKPQPAVLRVDP